MSKQNESTEINQANQVYFKGDYQKAHEIYEKLENTDPSVLNADAYDHWGESLTKMDKYMEAFFKYRAAANLLEKQSTYEQARKVWKKARCAGEQVRKKYQESQNTSDQLSGVNENKANEESEWIVLPLYGQLLQAVFGDLDLAVDIYEEAQKKYPQENGEYLSILIELVDICLERISENIDTYKWTEKRKILYQKIENILYQETEKVLIQLTNGQQDIEADESTVHFLRGFFNLRKPDCLAEAEKEFLAAKSSLDSNKNILLEKKNSKLSKINENLGVIYSRQGEFKKAAVFFETAISLTPNNLKLRSNLAKAYLQADRREEAESECQKILLVAPKNIDAHLGLGELYTLMGDDSDSEMYEEALKHFDLAITTIESGLKEGFARPAKQELAKIYYARGYTRAKVFETSKSASWLNKAKQDFTNSFNYAPTNLKAKRAASKVQARYSDLTPQQRQQNLSQGVIWWAASLLFIVAQVCFFLGTPSSKPDDQSDTKTENKSDAKAGNKAEEKAKPGTSPTTVAPIAKSLSLPGSPSRKPTASVGEPALLRNATPARAQASPKTTATPSAGVALAPATAKPANTNSSPSPSPSSPSTVPVSPGFRIPSISSGDYVSLTLGAIALIMVSGYLPQLSKLKVGVVELEKGSVEPIKAGGPLDIRK